MAHRVPVHRSLFQPTSQQVHRQYVQTPRRNKDLAFYNGAEWRKSKRFKFSTAPLCEPCRRAGRITVTPHVLYVYDHRLRTDLEYDFENHESMCLGCHVRSHAGRRWAGTG